MAEPDRLPLRDAVAASVVPGSAVYVGNFGAQLFAVGHELIRQGVRPLHLIVPAGGILLDQLIGAGVVGEATFAHCWNVVGPEPAWNLRRAVERGEPSLTLHELSLGWLYAGLTAAAWDVPFMPVPDLPGTGYADDGWTGGMAGTAESTFGRARVVRAIRPDVAFVHADQVDRLGNARIGQPLGETLVAAQAATRVVVVAEEVVPTEAIRAAGGADLPGLLVDAIVEEPFAVHPDGVAGRYQRDVDAYRRYAEASRTSDGFQVWLRRWVTGVADRAEYVLAGAGGGAASTNGGRPGEAARDR